MRISSIFSKNCLNYGKFGVAFNIRSLKTPNTLIHSSLGFTSISTLNLQKNFSSSNIDNDKIDSNTVTSVHIDFFRSVLGDKNVSVDKEDRIKYSTDWTQKYIGDSPVILHAQTTEHVSQVLKFCNENSLKVVPQSGNTGLVGGAVPINNEIVLLLTKMNKIEFFDHEQGFVECQGGIILENLMNEVGKYGFDVPWDLGARGSCTVGGNVSTGAGGINFVKNGHLRNYILGLEVVLANGNI